MRKRTNRSWTPKEAVLCPLVSCLMSCLQFSDLFNEGVILDYPQAPVSVFKLDLRKNGQLTQRENYSSIKLKLDPQALSIHSQPRVRRPDV